MKTRTLLIGGVAAAGIMASGWALAQTAGSGPGGFGPGMMHSMMQGMHGQTGHGMHGQMGGMQGQMGQGMHGQMGAMQGDQPAPFDSAQIDTLKTELGITTAQEPTWTKYATALQDAANAMKAAHADADPETVAKLSPADRFTFITAMREQAQKQFEAVQA